MAQSSSYSEYLAISIHALLAESDRRGGVFCYLDNIISIHALLAESDVFGFAWLAPGAYFYPRSPCGERRVKIPANTMLHFDFYPRSPCGERQRSADCNCRSARHFYPRSPCGERPGARSYPQCPYRFLSTLSLRRATFKKMKFNGATSNFYPRSPCGERRHQE